MFFKKKKAGARPLTPPASQENSESSQVDSPSLAPSRERYEMTRDGLIVFFGTAKDVSEATELLSPLKATCALMIRGLETTKSINDNKVALLDFVQTLDTHSRYFKTLTTNVEKEKFAKDDLLSALNPYKRELETLHKDALEAKSKLYGTPGLAIANRAVRSRLDVDQLRRWNDRLTMAHRLLTTSLQINELTQLSGLSRDLKVIHQLVDDLSASKPAKVAQAEPFNRSIYGMDLDGCEPGTRTDVIERIKRWGDDSTTEKQLFWLSGESATGKTTVAVTMYREWQGNGCLGGRFFFSQDDRSTSNTQRFCVAIARDMAIHIPSLQPAIMAAIKGTPASHFSLEVQFQRLVIEPLEQYDQRVYIVIDGLDSVSDPHERHRLLRCLIKELPKVRNVKILFSSPALLDIEEELGVSDLVERYELRLPPAESGEIDPDINLYIRKHLRNLSEDKVKTTLASLSKGYFPWIVPATFLLKRNRNGGELMEKMTRLGSPNHLDGLYYLYLERIVHKMWSPRLKMELLRVVITVLEPVSLETINSFLPCETKDLDGVRTLLSQLRGLLKSGDSDIPIRVRHSSFRDFCTDPVRAKEFHVDVNATHILLASQSMELLESFLHYNLLNIELRGVVIPQNVHVSDVNARLKDKLSPATAYASSYWPFHAAEALKHEGVSAQVARFLKCQFLPWAELVSWKGGVDDAIEGLSCLQTACDSLISIGEDVLDIKNLSNQAVTFMQHNRDVVKRSALQVYCSALGFAVKEALLIEHHRQGHKCPVVITGRRFPRESEARMDSGLLTLEISPNGQLIATVARDFALELFSSSTGESYKDSFSGHLSEVTSLAFSPDSLTLASGSADGQLRLWDLTNRLQIYSIEEPGAVVDIKFSPCGSYLLTISSSPRNGRKYTLRLWHIKEGQEFSVKFTYKDPFTVAVFSSDSSLIAAATQAGVFEVRSTSTGTLISTGNTLFHPSAIAISPDGGRLALSSRSHVQLWGLTEMPVRIAEMSVMVNTNRQALSFASNGKYLVYGSTVWDIETLPVSVWSGLRLPTALQRYMKGPESLLSYEEGRICSVHPQGPLLEIPSNYDVHSHTPWRAHGTKLVFAPENGSLVVVDCTRLLS